MYFIEKVLNPVPKEFTNWSQIVLEGLEREIHLPNLTLDFLKN